MLHKKKILFPVPCKTHTCTQYTQLKISEC